MANLDALAALGALDAADSIGNIDQLDNVTIHSATGTAATSATATAAEPIKMKGFSAVAATAATATADVGRTKGMVSAATGAAGSVTATAFLIRLVNGQPTANVSATATATHIRQVASVAAVTYAVTVANVGGSNVFVLNGSNNPTLSLLKGHVYIFDVSDATVSGHPLGFRTSGDNPYTGGSQVIGTAGTSGAKVVLIVKSNAPASFKYYCTVHGNAMGNTISVSASTQPPALATAEAGNPTPLTVINASASVTAAASATGQPVGVLSFVGSAGITTSASVHASTQILGEAWTVQPDTSGAWFVQ